MQNKSCRCQEKVEAKGEVNIVIEGNIVQQVDKFKYLRSYIADDGRCEVEIKTRIGLEKDASRKRKELLTTKMKRAEEDNKGGSVKCCITKT